MAKLLYDGDCGFCKKWITYWHRLSGDVVDIIPLQSVDLSNLGLDQTTLKTRIHFVDTTKDPIIIYTGAKAVIYTQYLAGHYKWLWWLYKGLPPFAWISEWIYNRIANNRSKLS